jgi:hypothetical protein
LNALSFLLRGIPLLLLARQRTDLALAFKAAQKSFLRDLDTGVFYVILNPEKG